MAVDLETLEDSPHLLDLMIQMEDVLDSLDIYVFENWMDGEIVEGPKVRRYWLDMTLMFEYKKMPDPRAGLRLLKHGVRVDFTKARVNDKGETSPLDEDAKEDAKDGDNGEKVWLVTVSIPRRLIAEINAGQLDFYDEEVDVDDVEDAQDQGMNDESGIVNQNDPNAPMDPNDPNATGDPLANPDEQQPPAPGGPR